MIHRRRFLGLLFAAASAGAGAAVAGCGGWWRVPSALIRPPQLRIAVPGFPTASGAAAVAALGRAATA